MTKKAHCQACSNLIHGVKTRKAIPHTCSKEQQAKTMELMQKKKVMHDFVLPGMIITKIILTKKEARTFSGFEIKCQLSFYAGPTITYNIEHHIELFDEKYPVGVYEWTGDKFLPLENTEEKQNDNEQI